MISFMLKLSNIIGTKLGCIDYLISQNVNKTQLELTYAQINQSL